MQSGRPVHLNPISSAIFHRTACELQTHFTYSFQALPKCCNYILSMRYKCAPFSIIIAKPRFKLHLFPDGEKIHVQDRSPMHPLCPILISTIQQSRVRAVRRMVGNGQIHQQFQQNLHCLAPQTYKLQFPNDYLQPIHTENIIFHIKNLIIKNSACLPPNLHGN